jgi:hypothetical protein
VAVKSVEPGVTTAGASTLHTEEVTLSFESILQVVSADANGSIDPVRFGWDLVTQQELQP